MNGIPFMRRSSKNRFTKFRSQLVFRKVNHGFLRRTHVKIVSEYDIFDSTESRRPVEETKASRSAGFGIIRIKN